MVGRCSLPNSGGDSRHTCVYRGRQGVRGGFRLFRAARDLFSGAPSFTRSPSRAGCLRWRASNQPFVPEDLKGLLSEVGFAEIEDMRIADVIGRYLGMKIPQAAGGVHMIRARRV